MATARTRVRHEGSFFSYEDSAHRIRDGRISGQDFFHLRGKVAMAVRTDPTFGPMYGGFAALRAAVGGSWTSPGMQQPDGKRVVVAAIRPPGAVLPAPIFESPGGPAHGSSSRRPTRARTSPRLLQLASRAAQAHWRPSARVGAVFEHGYAQCGYWSDVCHVSYCMYRQYLSSCVSWP